MKGVLFPRPEDDEDFENILKCGVMGVWQKHPDDVESWPLSGGRTPSNQGGTFADYTCLEPGDKVFFFGKRKIYGIGEVISAGQNNPAQLNYPESDRASPDNPCETDALYRFEDWKEVRVVIPFRESPDFFRKGVDMDIALDSKYSEYFSYLRFWQNQSFVLLSEEETKGLQQLILQNHQTSDKGLFESVEEHNRDEATSYSVNGQISAESEDYFKEDGALRVENFLHAAMVEALKLNDNEALPDSISSNRRKDVYREFPASPPKPPRYANSIDILTTTSHESKKEITTGYEIVELKKGHVTKKNFRNHVSQIMKYLEFIAEKYAGGNFDAIDAYYVAHSYGRSFKTKYQEAQEQGFEYKDGVPPIKRSYIMDANEDENPEINTWNQLKFLTYTWDKSKEKIVFKEKDFEE